MTLTECPFSISTGSSLPTLQMQIRLSVEQLAKVVVFNQSVSTTGPKKYDSIVTS